MEYIIKTMINDFANKHDIDYYEVNDFLKIVTTDLFDYMGIDNSSLVKVFEPVEDVEDHNRTILSETSLKELKELAKEQKVPLYSKMNKQELVDKLVMCGEVLREVRYEIKQKELRIRRIKRPKKMICIKVENVENNDNVEVHTNHNHNHVLSKREMYEKKTVKDLKLLCKTKGLKKYSTLKKSELIDLLSQCLSI